MSAFTPDPSHFTLTGAYYPKGHVFAMFPDLAAAHEAVHGLAHVPGIGEVQAVAAPDIERIFADRADEGGGGPSVGRENQFMLRFVELARSGNSAVVIDVVNADADTIAGVLTDRGAMLAYYYRAWVIEDLVPPTPGAEAAAAGRL